MRTAGLLLVAALAVAAAVWHHHRPAVLRLAPPMPAPRWEWRGGGPVVVLPQAAFVARVATFDDELYAYFNFDYVRSREALRAAEVLLTFDRGLYPLVIHPGDNLLAAIPFLENLRVQGFIPAYEWHWITPGHLARLRRQRQTFVSAYNFPVQRSLEEFTPEQTHEYVRRFVLFKSRTDPRIRRGIEPVPPTLTAGDAERLTADILTVTRFFDLPLDLFLGIGAMENNYMNVPGDLKHVVWKRRAEKGDTVVRRCGGRVLVRNPSAGVWQITRETLRYAHRVYLKDDRDYSMLPEHLRPPRELNLNEVQTAHLTIYAGLLFRHLIDRFQGDVALAVGAYNGGPRNPNMDYEKGVRLVAGYARRMMEQFAVLGGEPVVEKSFLSPAL